MQLLAWLWQNPFTRIVLLMALAFEVYSLAVIPSWQQIPALKAALAELEFEQRQADEAEKRQAGEAAAASAAAKLRIAEADAAAL
ncbi:MAG: hypothetical protein JSS20_16330, partial [Proteobacteria bacterium]|nr:hypothetical protein [Pseudomonadota bacterium]